METQLFLSDFKGRFYLRSPQCKHPTNIYFIASYKRRCVKISTGVRIIPDQWNANEQRAYISHRLSEIDNRNNEVVNDQIHKILQKFDLFRQYICTYPEKLVNFGEILRTYITTNMNGSKKMTLSDIILFLYRSITNDKSISEGMQNNYKKGVKALEAFLKYRESEKGEHVTTFKEFTTELFIEMSDFLVNHYRQSNGAPYSITSINDFLKLSNIAVKKYAVAGGLLTYSEAALIEYKQLTNKTSSQNEIALRNDEVMLLYRYKPTNKLDEIVRDVFLLECTTGQRISDTVRLDENVQIIAGIEVITLVTKKTSTKLRFNLLFDIARKILVDKYHYEVPECTKDQINKRIKKIAKEAGIKGTETISKHVAGCDKPTEIIKERYDCIASHTARRTFVSLLSLRNWNYEQIGKYTGQTTKIVEHYDKTTPLDREIFKRTPPQNIVKLIDEIDESKRHHDNKSVSSRPKTLTAKCTVSEFMRIVNEQLTPESKGVYI